ncbi:MAG: transposase [Methylovirgula sp.]
MLPSENGAPSLIALAARLDAEGPTTLVEGELDARAMGIGKGSKPPSSNMQTAVDADTGLIIYHEVTNEPNDTRQLYPMAKATKNMLGVESLAVVADAGYSNGTAAAACEADGITACAPSNRTINTQGDGMMFDRVAFTYGQKRTSISVRRVMFLPASSARRSHPLCGEGLRQLLTQAAIY